MALGGSLLAVIDDITAVLDDIATMSKLAAKKAGGVLGDDVALGAQQAQSKASDRELPIVWRIFKGSLINKLFLIPAALLIATIAPSLINVALFLGGVYLCVEGFEKVYEHFSSKHPEEAIKDTRSEDEKISGAIKTDMVLSLEVIILTLGLVGNSPFMTKLGVLAAIGVGMSIFVYGLIALIIRMDDRGLKMISSSKPGSLKAKIGSTLLVSAPRVMQIIGVVGTIAMFTVGGGILLHIAHIDLESLKNITKVTFGMFENIWGVNGFMQLMLELTTGLILGFIAFSVWSPIHSLINKNKTH